MSKFGLTTMVVKRNLRAKRLKLGISMYEMARRAGISLKKLEDALTEADYGCYLELELLCKLSIAVDEPIERLLIPS